MNNQPTKNQHPVENLVNNLLTGSRFDFGDKSSIFEFLYRGGIPYADDDSIEESNMTENSNPDVQAI